MPTPKVNPDMYRDAVLKRLIVEDHPVILDVGANEGQSAEGFLTLFNAPVVHCFEPIPQLCELLKTKFHGRPDVNVVPCAVSAKNGRAQFHVNAFSQSSSLEPLNEQGAFRTIKNTHTVDVIDVDVISLDDYCKDAEISQIEFLKIDAQGHSADVLKGAQSLLASRSIKLIQVEILFHNFYEKTESFSSIEAQLSQHGYRLYTIFHTDSEKIGEFAFNWSSGEIWYLDALYIRTDA
jgi:FkbM family methyltransferase